MKVSLIVATTADGFIARDADHLVDWTEPADKEFFHAKTKEIGTVIMGINTYRTLPGPLEGRLNIVMSTSARPEQNRPGLLEFFSGEPKDLLDELSRRGTEEVALSGGGQLDASFFLDNLIDEIYLTVSPLLFGQGLSLSTGYDLECDLKLLDYQPLGDNSMLLHYQVLK